MNVYFGRFGGVCNDATLLGLDRKDRCRGVNVAQNA